MRNCIIAQSGGPTAVINSSVVGIYEKNMKDKYFDKVYFSINGIEGILNENILDTDCISKSKILNLKLTPSSGLGSCRYKLCDFNQDDSDYKKVLSILKKYNIDTFFYIGGNDSMDTILKFSQYIKKTHDNIKFIGIPKTIDNDLLGTDHCPGFGSAAKLISTITLETFLDTSVYIDNGIFILETMGRDTGWLAASATLAKLNDKSVVDFIYLPEIAFSKENFLKDVENLYKKKKHVFIVVSEGIKDSYGNFISETIGLSHDKFSHKQLGGASKVLKDLIIQSKITSRVKILELGIIQRCSMHCVSKTDLQEAYNVGAYGIELSKNNCTGVMSSISRINNDNYKSSIGYEDLSNIANKTKYFPEKWINSEGNNVTEDAFNYILPLTKGNIDLKYINGIPYYSNIYNKF
ncbi:6-phosphofructokinase [Clostridium niameyense]|uniref:6-phosphofructokinase n=1 Tax=Clostridium niameyense TaxID=1622073 RepID=UPI00067F4C4E|nr:6-phosphofructokinase [Clostridium niameyense]